MFRFANSGKLKRYLPCLMIFIIILSLFSFAFPQEAEAEALTFMGAMKSLGLLGTVFTAGAGVFGAAVDSWVTELFTSMVNVLLSFFGLLLLLAGFLLNFAVKITVEHMPLFVKNEGVRAAWAIIRDVVNITFIFGIVYIAISTILRANGPNIKELLGKLILAAVLVNFSFFFAGVIIDASNILTLVLYKEIASVEPRIVEPQLAQAGTATGQCWRIDQNKPMSPGITRDWCEREMKKGWGTVEWRLGPIIPAASCEAERQVSGDPCKDVPGSFSAGINLMSGGISAIFMDNLRLPSLFDASRSVEVGRTKESGELPFITEGERAGGSQLSLTNIVMLGIFASILIFILAFSFLTIALLLFIRLIVLVVLMALSPVAFLGWVFPELQKWSDKWWAAMWNQATFAPLYMLMTLVVVTIISSPDWVTSLDQVFPTSAKLKDQSLRSAFSVAGGFKTNAMIIVNYILVMGMLIASVNIAKSTSAKSHEFVDNLVKGASRGVDSLKGWTKKRTVGALGRQTIGRASEAAAGALSRRRKEMAERGASLLNLRATDKLEAFARKGAESKFIGAGLSRAEAVEEKRTYIKNRMAEMTPEQQSGFIENLPKEGQIWAHNHLSTGNKVALELAMEKRALSEADDPGVSEAIKEKREEKAQLVTDLNNTTDPQKKAQLEGKIEELERGITQKIREKEINREAAKLVVDGKIARLRKGTALKKGDEEAIEEKREEKEQLETALNNTTDPRKKAQLKGEIKTLEEGIKTLEKGEAVIIDGWNPLSAEEIEKIKTESTRSEKARASRESRGAITTIVRKENLEEMKGVIKEKREEKARLVTALNNTTDQRKRVQLKGEIEELEEGIETLEKEKSTLDQRIEEGETTNSRTGLPFENIKEAMDQLPVDDTYKINEDIITNDAVVDHLSPERLRNIRSKAALPSNKLEEIKNKILRDEKGRPGIGKVREAIEETEGVIKEMKGVIEETSKKKVQLEKDLINATDQQKVQLEGKIKTLEGKIKTLGEKIKTLGEEIETQEERGRVQQKNLDTILREQNLQQKTIMDEAVRHFWGVTEEERENWLKANEKEDEEKKIITPPYTSKDYS